MEKLKPALPDAAAAAAAVKHWAATEPGLAALLHAGVPEVAALARWALELLRAKRIAEAIAALRAALAESPEDAALWANYGLALSQSGEVPEAVACLEHSLALSPQQPDTWMMLGMARKQLGDPVAAETAYRRALALQPNSAVGWELLGVLKEEQKDFAEAIACLTACLQADGTRAAVWANLGKLQYQTGRIAESAGSYEAAVRLDPASARYRQMARRSAFLRNVLQAESLDAAIAEYRNTSPPGECVSEKELGALLHSGFSLLSGFGHLEAARRVGRKQVELWPDDPSVAYLLSAVGAEGAYDRSPAGYVIEHFNAFAGRFDAKLVGDLGYDIPEKICRAVRDLTPDGRLHDTLDAGCGTGLCGPLLRPVSRSLSGVDLSPGMLELAARKGVYDELACEELTAFLARSAGRFDLIVAADLLVYFGDLAPLFAAAAAALRPGGLFAVSTEAWAGDGWKLQPSGRFAHAADYVRLAAGKPFTEAFQLETTIRLEANRRLPGNIFVFRRGG